MEHIVKQLKIVYILTLVLTLVNIVVEGLNSVSTIILIVLLIIQPPLIAYLSRRVESAY